MKVSSSFGHECWLIFRHELVGSFRDWRSLIYTLVVPMFVMLFGFAGAIGKRYEDSRVIRIAIERPAATSQSCRKLIEAFEHSSKMEIDASTSPSKQLRDHEVDAVIGFPQGDKTIELTFRATSAGEEQAASLRRIVARIRDHVFSELPTNKQLPKNIEYSFDTYTTDEKSSNTSFVQIVMLLVGLLFCRLGFSMSYSARSVWLDDVGTGKLETLLVLPIERLSLASAKSAVMIVLAFIRLLVDGIAFMTLTVFIALFYALAPKALSGLSAAHNSKAADLSKYSHLPWTAFATMTFIDLAAFSFLCASIILLVVVSVNRKHASLVLTFVLTFVTIPPLIAFFPDAKLNAVSLYVPVVNLTMTLRQLLLGVATTEQLAIAVLEIVVIGAILTVIATKMMASERFLLKDAS